MGHGNQLSMPSGKRSRSGCQSARYEVLGKKPIIFLSSLAVKSLFWLALGADEFVVSFVIFR